MANDKNLQGVYNTLKKEGYTPPEYSQFVKDMQDDKNLQGVYNTLKKEGYTPPEYAQFKTDMFGEEQPQQTAPPTTEAQPTAEVASAPAEQTQSEPAQPAWQPTEQEKIAMSYQLHQTMDGFNKRSKEMLDQTRRMSEHFTPEGRERLKAAKFQAQLAGTPTSVMGLTPPTPASSDGEQSEGGTQSEVSNPPCLTE